MTLDIEKIFVAHYSPLKDRKEFLTKYFERNGIDIVEWVENEDYPDNFWQTNSESWTRKISYAYPKVIDTARRLSPQERSVALKHYRIFERILREDEENFLVLEDDVFFASNFVDLFNTCLGATPKDWDVIMIGTGGNLHVPLVETGKVAYLKDHPATRCLDSYIIRKSIVKKIMEMEDLLPIDLPIDFELAYVFKKLDIKTYWWEPGITIQGSQNGFYKPAIPH
jgi:GR25 family glycosyltransferase involved in LPS biosynthesis